MFFDNYSKKNVEKSWKGKIFSAKFPSTDMNLIDARKHINSDPTKFFLSELQTDTAITTKKSSTKKTNYYFKKFNQGATITPRNFYFFDYNQSDPGKLKNKKINIKTSEIINANAKKPWKDKKLEGLVNTNHIYLTCLSNSILPFSLTNLYKVILPIRKSSQNTIDLYTSDMMQNDGDLDSARWFELAENMWNKHRSNKSLNIYTRLNYQKLLTDQDLNMRYVVLYTSSAKDVSAAIFDRNLYELDLIIESKNYCFFTNNKNEAYYLLSFLNSNYANKMIKDFQTKGDFGHRDIHKRILKVPLNEFDNSNKNHLQIVKLAKDCELISKEVTKLDTKVNSSLSPLVLGKLRLKIRNKIETNLIRIDKILNNK